jgi:hypothetical protein
MNKAIEMFALQFFFAGHGHGTTVQAARSRIRKWQGMGHRDLGFYTDAVKRYEALKHSGLTIRQAADEHRRLLWQDVGGLKWQPIGGTL